MNKLDLVGNLGRILAKELIEERERRRPQGIISGTDPSRAALELSERKAAVMVILRS